MTSGFRLDSSSLPGAKAQTSQEPTRIPSPGGGPSGRSHNGHRGDATAPTGLRKCEGPPGGVSRRPQALGRGRARDARLRGPGEPRAGHPPIICAMVFSYSATIFLREKWTRVGTVTTAQNGLFHTGPRAGHRQPDRGPDDRSGLTRLGPLPTAALASHTHGLFSSCPRRLTPRPVQSLPGLPATH